MKRVGTWSVIAVLTALSAWCLGCGSDKKTEDPAPAAFEGSLEEKTAEATHCVDTLDTCQAACFDKNAIEPAGPAQCKEILDGCLKKVPPSLDCRKQVDACVKKVGEAREANQATEEALGDCLAGCGQGLDDCTEALHTAQQDFVDGCVEAQKKCLAGCPTVEEACESESAEAVEDYVMQSIDRIYAQVLDCIKTIRGNVGFESIKQCVDKAYDVIFDVATPPCAAPIAECHQACREKTRACLHPEP